MRKVIFLLVPLMAMLFSGCPNIPVPGFPNRLIVINQHAHNITQVSVTKIVCGDNVPVGVNILPENLLPGETFEVPNLSDGEYSILITYQYERVSDLIEIPKYFRQFIEGDVDYTLYFKGDSGI